MLVVSASYRTENDLFRSGISSSIRNKAMCPQIVLLRVLDQTSAGLIVATGSRSVGDRSSFSLVLLCELFAVTFYLESLMTSVFLKRSEKAWSCDAELKLGMMLKFAPQRIPRKFIEGNEVDRLHSENRFDFRKPTLALVSDRVSILSYIL